MATFAFLAYVTLLVGMLVWMSALFLKMGLGIVGVFNTTRRRRWSAAFVYSLTTILASWALWYLPDPRNNAEVALEIASKGSAFVLITMFVIGGFFRISVWRSLVACVPMLLAPAIVMLVHTAQQPFAFEGFTARLNNMAPLIRGEHYRGTCTECGAPGYWHCRDLGFAEPSCDAMICENFHLSLRPFDALARPKKSDKFIVSKFVQPKRFDIVAAGLKDANPSMIARIVGLPGERVSIDQGVISIDGEVLDIPDSVPNVQPLHPERISTGGEVVELGDDEFFSCTTTRITTAAQTISSRGLISPAWSRMCIGHPPVGECFVEFALLTKYGGTDGFKESA